MLTGGVSGAVRTARTHAAVALTLAVAATSSLAAQQKLLTIDDLYDPAARVNFTGTPPTGLSWMDASHYVWPKAAGNPGQVEWTKVDAASGRADPLFDADRMERALAAVPGVSADDARREPHARSLVFDAAYTAALATIGTDLYLYHFADGQAARLTDGAGAVEEPSFNPQGTYVAFVRHHDLFVVDVAARRESALTTDGSVKILNGTFDWVYEEEIYGRGRKRAYWWSPDGSRIAFLRIDDTPVPTFEIVNELPYQPEVEHQDYPKAGDPNPTVKIGVARVAGGAPTWVDLEKYTPTDSLVVGVSWKPDSGALVYEVQNRTQTWLDLDLADLESSSSRTLFRETSEAWVNPKDGDDPIWLKDGSFLWLSERSGWKHLYHYRSDGTLVKQVTDGNWELRTLHGIDPDTGWVYFSGTERSPIGEDVYRVKVDGSGLERLSKATGTHTATFSPGFAYYLDIWSNAVTPPQVRLYRANGSELRVIDENRVAALKDYRLSAPEFLHVTTRDGFVMEAMMIKPPDFVATRRYPVYQLTYGGPHLPLVRDAWGGTEYLYHQLLAQTGIIVWMCDNRTASGKGIVSTWPVYRHFGELELKDIEDGLSWLKAQPYVDGSRIGIHGWSYGGFLTSYALTHSTSFVMGIAGGTVSDWRDYDTVYTERYMGLPQENPDGYRASSPRFAAKDLHGALLLIHGAMDDNVHIQNTMQFAYELQQAQKPFQLMIYPPSRHGVTDPALVKQLRTTMVDFILQNLKPGAPAPTVTAAR